jgi:hypothetical protein
MPSDKSLTRGNSITQIWNARFLSKYFIPHSFTAVSKDSGKAKHQCISSLITSWKCFKMISSLSTHMCLTRNTATHTVKHLINYFSILILYHKHPWSFPNKKLQMYARLTESKSQEETQPCVCALFGRFVFSVPQMVVMYNTFPHLNNLYKHNIH